LVRMPLLKQKQYRQRHTRAFVAQENFE